MSFDVHHLKTLRDAAIWDLPQQMAYLDIPGDPIIAFPQYFLQVKTGEIIRQIADLPNECAVLTRLQRVVREQLPLRDPEDRMEVMYDSKTTRVFSTHSVRQLAHWLCAKSYVGEYREIVGAETTIRKEWYWRPDPDKINFEILIYPSPCSFDTIDVEEHWVNPKTLDIKIRVPYNDNYLVVVLDNDVLENIVWLTLPHRDDEE